MSSQYRQKIDPPKKGRHGKNGAKLEESKQVRARRIRKLEYRLERDRTAQRLTELENQARQTRAAWRVTKSEYELEKLKRGEQEWNLEGMDIDEGTLDFCVPERNFDEDPDTQVEMEDLRESAQPIQEAQTEVSISIDPSDSQSENFPALLSISTGNINPTERPADMKTNGVEDEEAYDSQTVSAPPLPQLVAQSSSEASPTNLETHNHNAHTSVHNNSSFSEISANANQPCQSSHQASSAPDGVSIGDDGLPILELRYYREIDIPADGLELSFLDMDLEELYEVAGSLEPTPETDLQEVKLLGVIHYYIFSKTGAVEDLQNAINKIEEVVSGTDINSPNYALSLKDLITMLIKKYNCTDSLEDISQAILRAEEMVTLTHRDQGQQFLDLFRMKGIKAIRTGSSEELKETKAMWETITATDTLVGNYLTTYERTGDKNDLQMAVAAVPDDQPIRPFVKAKLVDFFNARFTETGDTNELQMTLTILPNGHPIRPYILEELASSFGIKFDKTGSMEDLNMCIETAKEAMVIMPHDDIEEKTAISVMLANKLQSRFERSPTEDMADLEMAIKILEESSIISRHNSSHRSVVLGSLAAALYIKSEWTNNLEYLQMAIALGEEILAAESLNGFFGGPEKQNLAVFIHSRYERTRDLDDLQRSITLAGEAVESFNRYYEHSNANANAIDINVENQRVSCLGNLAGYLHTRYELTGNLDDLELAIETTKKARATVSSESPSYSKCQNNLVNYLRERYLRAGNFDDLQMAIHIGEELIRRDNNPARTASLIGLIVTFGDRFGKTGNIDDLDKAIKLSEEAIATTLDQSEKAMILHNSVGYFANKFEYTANIEYLDMAVQKAEEAVALKADNHPEKGTFLANLATALTSRSSKTRNFNDFQKALYYFQEVVRLPNTTPHHRIESANSATQMLAGNNMWSEASQMIEIAVGLLPLSVSRELKHRDQQHNLKKHAGLSSRAASIVLNAGKDAYDAVKLLELGRGVMTGLRLGSRSDLTELRLQHPDIAAKFEQLRDILDSPASGTFESAVIYDSKALDESPTLRRKNNERFDANLEFNKTIDQIRLLPNFENFLRPPAPDDLMTAASLGPVVIINISRYRCDALLVEQQTIRSFPLPNLLLKDIEKHAEFMQSIRSAHRLCSDTLRQMFRMLEWLWDAAVGPILDSLGLSSPPVNEDGEWPRIWWIPTGQLSLLPLHAAGYHHPGSTKTTLDRVVSSYTSSIKALLYGRQNSQTMTKFTPGKTLLVSMDQTPKQSDLPYAAEEVKMLQGLLPTRLTTETIKLEQPNKQDVLDHLEDCTIFHYAGHGESNSLEPEKSSLLINDWQTNPLTVEHLTELNFRQKSSAPWLAYLSACSTSDSNAEKLHDESINLVTACQLAGFQHVVGSLWEISDKHSVTAAEEVYKTIAAEDGGVIDGKKVSLGVHRATRRLRELTRGVAGNRAMADSTESPVLPKEIDDEECAAECAGLILESSRGIVGEGNELRTSRKLRPRGYEKVEEVTVGNPLIWAAYVHVGP
ncbi:hypothetical protein AOL_s00210g265 [Orbilia oligospora ATCC 24927]|uniref:CHAT domain-containing protein n=1 Tax=Arthrobotrys oligospora (strain ATCC 24927 / CBS 115.81 / DSM 1491) TaxID=756982 RepID=G1XSA7_ARTOA|nr:hypothetical protein AOL_s00210g265 [Orbilia oligospora ATCC 24927]EGX43949.1 hypothetical protein AOL_s00210g265 [Orbilia oligospora ATCC 24927]